MTKKTQITSSNKKTSNKKVGKEVLKKTAKKSEPAVKKTTVAVKKPEKFDAEGAYTRLRGRVLKLEKLFAELAEMEKKSSKSSKSDKVYEDKFYDGENIIVS